MWKELAIAIVSITLGVLGLVFGEHLWNFIGIENASLRNSLTLIFPIYLVLVGFLLSFFFFFERNRKEISILKNTIISEIGHAVPRLDILNNFDGREGIAIVANKLAEVKKVLNTRLIPPGYKGVLYDRETAVWNENIIKYVREGLVFVDIVSGKGLDSAKSIETRLQDSKRKIKGRYTIVELDLNFESFLNFKIFFLEDKSKELWFGWKISPTTEMDEMCFKTADRNLLKTFEAWHRDLQRSGRDSTRTLSQSNPAP